APDRVDVGLGQARGPSPARAHPALRHRARKDHEHVRPEARDLLLDRVLGALADGEHRDDRGDADDDAESRERGTHEVPLQRSERDEGDLRKVDHSDQNIRPNPGRPPGRAAEAAPPAISVTMGSFSWTSPDTISVHWPSVIPATIGTRCGVSPLRTQIESPGRPPPNPPPLP